MMRRLLSSPQAMLTLSIGFPIFGCWAGFLVWCFLPGSIVVPLTGLTVSLPGMYFFIRATWVTATASAVTNGVIPALRRLHAAAKAVEDYTDIPGAPHDAVNERISLIAAENRAALAEAEKVLDALGVELVDDHLVDDH